MPDYDRIDNESAHYSDDDPIVEQTEADVAAARDNVSVLGWSATRYAAETGTSEDGERSPQAASNASDVNSVDELIPDDIRDILGEPNLSTGEDPSRYQKMLCRLAVEHNPQSIGDWMLVRDICDVYWEVIRFKAAVAAHTSIAAPHMAYQMLKQRLDFFTGGVSELFKLEFMDLISRGFGKGPQEETNTEIILRQVGIAPSTLVRSTLATDLEFVEKCNRILETLEKRLQRLTRHLVDRKSIASSSLDVRPKSDRREQLGGGDGS